jgi:hypothetical protein
MGTCAPVRTDAVWQLSSMAALLLAPFAAAFLTDEADDEADDAERATALAHAVLFSVDLWLELWPWMDRGSKQALRSVNLAMRAQVEGSIGAAASPDSGFSSDALRHALATMARFPGLRDLALINVSAASGMQPLATALLSGVTSLTMRQVGMRSMRAHTLVNMRATLCGIQPLA